MVDSLAGIGPARDLTVGGMRQGVMDCAVFVMLLTARVLSRLFCHKELGWAIEFGKPIV